MTSHAPGADEALRQIGVTQAMSGRGLHTFDCQKEGVLSKVCKEGVLRGWCELGEQVQLDCSLIAA